MEVTLEPSVLRWARERANLSVEKLAHKMAVAPVRVVAWEASGQLTLKQAEKLAAKTYTPMGALYLDAPPIETLPIADFRTVGSSAVQAPSPELLDTLDSALERQEWFREHALANGEAPLDWVGALRGDEDIVKAAQWICQRFDLKTSVRTQATSWEDALRLHCEDLERAGVLVMRNGVVGENTRRPLSVEEFRGFALADAYAPLLFINSRDWKAAQMFTLMHELVHLILNISGISNLEQTYAPNQKFEPFCNRVAAEILVPAAELRARFVQGFKEIAELSRHFKVSLAVMLRRLHDLGLITRQDFIQQYRALETRSRLEAQNSDGGGDYYRTKISRLGKRFAYALLESALEGRTAPREALRLLGLRNTEKMRKLAQALEFAL